MWFRSKRKYSDETPFTLQVDGVSVLVTRKEVKHLRLRLVPPGGEVYISAPFSVSDTKITEFVRSHIDWIQKKQAILTSRSAESENTPANPNRICLLGKHYDLRLFPDSKPSAAVMGQTVDLYLPDPESAGKRELLLKELYRSALQKELDTLIPEWSRTMNVHPKEWRIRQMRTRWGTCNTVYRRIWINEELGKRPRHLIEYIVVHELCHLLERGHTARFYGLMEHFLPDWKKRKSELNGR